MSSIRRFALVVVLASFFAGWACACAGDEDDARRWMGAVRQASEASAELEASGDRPGAIEALAGLVDREPPASVAEGDARVVRQDAYARLARLRRLEGDAEGAARAAQAGLALGDDDDDLFTAQLLVERGRAREAGGDEIEAAEDYHRALVMHQALLEAALGGQR